MTSPIFAWRLFSLNEYDLYLLLPQVKKNVPTSYSHLKKVSGCVHNIIMIKVTKV